MIGAEIHSSAHEELYGLLTERRNLCRWWSPSVFVGISSLLLTTMLHLDTQHPSATLLEHALFGSKSTTFSRYEYDGIMTQPLSVKKLSCARKTADVFASSWPLGVPPVRDVYWCLGQGKEDVVKYGSEVASYSLESMVCKSSLQDVLEYARVVCRMV